MRSFGGPGRSGAGMGAALAASTAARSAASAVVVRVSSEGLTFMANSATMRGTREGVLYTASNTVSCGAECTHRNASVSGFLMTFAGFFSGWQGAFCFCLFGVREIEEPHAFQVGVRPPIPEALRQALGEVPQHLLAVVGTLFPLLFRLDNVLLGDGPPPPAGGRRGR